MGDCVASLVAVKALGGGDYKIGFRPEGQRESMRGYRFDAIQPLLTHQHYINSCEWTEKTDGFGKDFSTFRSRYQLHGNLAEQQARHIGVQVSTIEPWLKVIPSYHDNVVIARTSRYHNPMFPWRKIVERFKNKIFVGSVVEHKDFQSQFGKIEFQPTQNLLELAQVIAGCKMLVSNQSCPFWIAAGLGMPLIQETYLSDMNSIVLRSNCSYTRNAREINDLLGAL